MSTNVISMRQLLEAGVHFGHQTKRWNPKMKKYIFTARNDIHVIDLQQTLQLIMSTYQYVKNIAEKGGKVLFVGTKKQAQEAIELEAKRSGMYYVNQRWLGGTLTNLETIRKSIRRLHKIEKMKADGLFEILPTKEVSQLQKELNRLEHYLGGIKDMKKLPDLIFIVDTKKEEIAVKEGRKLKIPIVGIVDTNCDPDEVTHPIPANDDAIRAIKLLTSVFANAIIEGTHGQIEKSAEEAAAEEEELKEFQELAIGEEDVEEGEITSEDIEASFVNLKEEDVGE